MPYFAVPYRVLFHDTMAYGTHHFLTNFKFQCEAREQLLFGEVLGNSPGDEASLRDLVFLTQQAYSRNLAAVGVGEMVGILLSFEDESDSSLRFCFRVVRHDGAPVACGFQTIVCMSKQTLSIVAAPRPLLRYREMLRERLTEPNFAARVLTGKLQEIFSEEVIRIGREVALTHVTGMYPVTSSAATLPTKATAGGLGTVLVFPGQGSFDWSDFRQLKELGTHHSRLLRRVDEISESLLGQPLWPLIGTAVESNYVSLMHTHPHIAQLGTYLSGWMGARFLLDQGLRPDALTGHSAGELTALAVGGGYSVEEGAELLCGRIAALASMGDKLGGMLALFCDAKRARGLIDASLARDACVAVLNHPEQTVVSGREDDLDRLSHLASQLSIGLERLSSCYPFHSELLSPAAKYFTQALGAGELKEPSIPVYSPMEGSFYAGGLRLSSVLPSHFVRQLDFGKAVNELYGMGARRFVGCGGGAVVVGLIRRILKDKESVRALSTNASSAPIGQSLERILSEYGARGPLAVEPPSSGLATEKQHIDHDSELAEECDVPIAIVGLGSALPGAESPEELWENILAGVGAIADLAAVSPDVAADFLSPGDVVPDKTYTLNCGILKQGNTADLPVRLRDAGLSSSQSILARATAQCLANVKIDSSQQVGYFVGSTADGTVELDQALVLASLERVLQKVAGQPKDTEMMRRVLRTAFGQSTESASRWAPYAAWKLVAEKLLGTRTKVLAVDAACASSLYTIGLGVNALRDGACDVAFCGGTFAPGPANSSLFSQFRGLSATGSRPFDAGADGVVFSPGSAVIALKRLPDALASGDSIFALVRGISTSSDGKSVSAAEPKKVGQLLALKRAYARSGVDPATVQYIEAHATSTPVGDAVEFNALTEMFRGNTKGSITLGSVKALIGHTGWAAGAASIIKVCLALREKILPPQANFSCPNPNIDLEGSSFVIPKSPRPWARGSAPRRAGVNGFGFGGTNAHLILEEYDAANTRCFESAKHPAAERETLALVGLGSLFAAGSAEAAAKAGVRQHFGSDELQLPRSKRMLPEMLAHIDRAQFLALMAAEKALEHLGGRWVNWRDEIGVVFGVEAKTSRSLTATQRIYADFVRRHLRAAREHDGAELTRDAWLRLEEQLLAELETSPPSNAYTLPGLMPNVIAGRVSNVFDLHGPNFVVDAGAASLAEALSLAEIMLRRGECEMVLAGGICGNDRAEARLVIDADVSSSRPVAEAALVLALTSREKARTEGLEVLAELSFSPSGAEAACRFEVGKSHPYLMGAEGAIEVVLALEQSRRTSEASIVSWPECSMGVKELGWHVTAAQRDYDRDEKRPGSGPVHVCAPRLVAVPAATRLRQSLRTKRILALIDQPEAIRLLDGLRCTVVHPAGINISSSTAIDLTSEETIKDALDQIDPSAIDAILVVKMLGGAEPDLALAEGARGGGLLDLAFVATRHCYDGLREGRVALAALCTEAWQNGHLHAYTGLFGGFMKSLSRELPQSTSKAIYTDEAVPARALAQVETELDQGASAPAEIAYRGGQRLLFTLAQLPRVTSDSAPQLDAGSVVLAPGGGRGVTAILVEELLSQAPCTVYLLGRTDPKTLPSNLRAMSEQEFDEFEGEFYRQEIGRTPGTPVRILRARYQEYRAAREVLATLARLRQGTGRVFYRQLDVTDASAVDALVRYVVREQSRVDFVLHGAAVQVSRKLQAKTLEEFRRIVKTKLGGVLNFRDACRKHQPGHAVRHHLLTSAFSFFGNDGQPDYGAANEAMNRYSEQSADGEGLWTAVAWLGWEGVGMTRGSEYAALARIRGLHPISLKEGRQIFASFLRGRASSPSNILLTEGERAFYGLTYTTDSANPETNGNACKGKTSSPLLGHWRLSVEEQPYLNDHRVNGVPTLPGTFEIDMAVRSAKEIRPGRLLASVENATFNRFVKLHNGRQIELQARTQVIRDNSHETVLGVELYSDFTHKSGVVLQKDLLHFSAVVHLTEQDSLLKSQSSPVGGSLGVAVSDPYVDPRSPVTLCGFFNCLEGIEINDDHRSARFRMKDASKLSQLGKFHIPSVLIDSLCRFAMIHVESNGEMPLYVPTRCRRALIAPGINDLTLHASGWRVFLYALTPRVEGEEIYSERAEACDNNGRTLLIVEGLSAMRARET